MATAVSLPSAQPAHQNQSVTASPPQTPQAAPGGFANASLYVGDLDVSVTEGQLYDVFNQVAPVVSVRVCRDHARRVSLGYAYVNFSNAQDAANARDLLNFTPINGKPIRIMFSQRDPSIRKSGHANVFVKNLDTSIDNKALHDTFASFGNVLSCKVAVDGNGKSKGYGFVQFDQEEAAQNAIKQLHGMLINDKQVYLGIFVRHQDRNQSNGSPKFTNVYVKNFSETTTDEDLRKFFAKYGTITSAVVMRDANGKSRCFGFVNFQNPDAAATAVVNLNGTSINDGKVLYVGKAQRKAEREAEFKTKYEQERNNTSESLQGANLYLKNLDARINDEKLKELFSEFGTVTSCKVMLDPQGVSKGSGFVAFSTPKEAARALSEMNGKMIGWKPLYVAVAQRKEERRAQMQAHFSHIGAPAGMASLPTGMAGFYPGPPRLAPHQLYFGHDTPGLVPPLPAGYGFQQQLFPGFYSGGSPNFVWPYQVLRHGQPGQQSGIRRGRNPQQMRQPQVVHHHNSNQSFKYMANRNGMHHPSMVHRGLVSPIMSLPLDVSGTATSAKRSGPEAMSTLASALASATPENQQKMLGEHLFPLVQRLGHDNAGKVTGMLLEMDQTEVLHLIESPDALKKKVAEATDVLCLAASGSN
ncbi:polyadenylate-binding protein 3-like [Cornus florida]|uniref:polyadenylate-binding protein 3-like n=1 Tax=Cornus florida TaxID=4283 RepID=UPI00289699ED|nr:polyadenylate-binding protein 3-like [Cornus florida]